jgi:2-polyprenyl-3-methyl-5-hydroxy-6-metoxy-1,4-benzoquinol methylase
MTIKTRLITAIVAFGFVAALGDVAAGQLASRPADDWIARLERPERIAGLKIDYIISKLELKPGQVVADVGAGPGVLSLPMAKAVSPGGKVYAIEIDQAFLTHIEKKTKDQHVTNVTLVLGKFTDPNLPAKDVDVALFHDVLHHIDDRAGYLKAMATYMKPSGRVAIIDLPPDGSHKDDPKLVVTKDQVKGWMADAGFKPVQEFDGLSEGKWFIVYARK